MSSKARSRSGPTVSTACAGKVSAPTSRVISGWARRLCAHAGKVGDRLQVHPASVTNTVNRLEADGLVARKPHPTDRRTTLAVLTRDGRRRVEQAAVALAAIEFGVAGLTGDGRRAVDAAILELRVAAGDFVAPPSQRR